MATVTVRRKGVRNSSDENLRKLYHGTWYDMTDNRKVLKTQARR
jgi:hypothetical protein